MKIQRFKFTDLHGYAMVFHSGLTPDLKNTKISAQIYMPVVTVTSDFKSSAKLALMSVKPEGVLNIELSECVAIPLLDRNVLHLLR